MVNSANGGNRWALLIDTNTYPNLPEDEQILPPRPSSVTGTRASKCGSCSSLPTSPTPAISSSLVPGGLRDSGAEGDLYQLLGRALSDRGTRDAQRRRGPNQDHWSTQSEFISGHEQGTQIALVPSSATGPWRSARLGLLVDSLPLCTLGLGGDRSLVTRGRLLRSDSDKEVMV